MLKVFKNISVKKFSGYKFLSLFLNYLEKNKNKSIFCIDPNLKFSKSNKNLFKRLGIKKIHNYLAPKYQIENISDRKLLNKIKNEIELSYQKNKNLSISYLDLIQKKFQKKIEKEGFKIDYLDISDSETLEEVKLDTKFILIAIAVFYKKVRLIDNLILDLTSFS